MNATLDETPHTGAHETQVVNLHYDIAANF